MGNQLAASGAAAGVNLSDIGDNAKNLQLIAPLGGLKRGRLFTSLHCRQATSTSDVVVKIFVQRSEDKAQTLAITNFQEALQTMELQLRRYFKANPEAPCNILFYTLRSRQGGYCLLQRPYIHYSLAERLQMRPFWEPAQRLFACYQLLQALVQLHDGCKCAHGDLKPENVLISTQDWLYITDFSPYKPPTLPTNNPANFEYYYDNAETRNCCCAPEKFLDRPQAGAASSSDAITSPSSPAALTLLTTGDVTMDKTSRSASVAAENLLGHGQHHLKTSDVFAAACIIIFILSDEPLFKLSGALEFKSKTPAQRKEFLTKELTQRKLEPKMIFMLCEIMCCEPALRPSASKILKRFTPSVFPHTFGFLHSNVIPALQQKAPDAQVQFLFNRYVDILQAVDRCDPLSSTTLEGNRFGSNSTDGAAIEPLSLDGGADGEDINNRPNGFAEMMSLDLHTFRKLEQKKADEEELRLKSRSAANSPPPQRVQTADSDFADFTLVTISGTPPRTYESSEQMPIPSSTSNLCSPNVTSTKPPPSGEEGTLPAQTTDSVSSVPPSPIARGLVPTLLLPYVTSVLRYVRSTDSRCKAMLILRRWILWASENCRREIILPWARLVLLSRRAGLLARVHAVRTLRDVLVSIPQLSSKEAFLFEDYVLDVFESLLREPGVLAPQATNSALPTASTVEGVLMLQPMLSLLTETAAALPDMLVVGCSYVRQRQRLYSQIAQHSASRRLAGGEGASAGAAGAAFASFDNELSEIVDRGWEVMKVLLSTNQSAIAVAALKKLPAICSVLGQERVTSELLPILTTFLSSTATEVKVEFLQQVPFLGSFLHGAVVAGAGGAGVNAPASFLAMVIEDGLRQADIGCICAALESTRVAAEAKVIPTEILMPTVNTALRHLHSVNAWVRDAACALVESVAKCYSPSELLLHVAKPMLGRLRRPVPLVALSQFKDAIKPFWEVNSTSKQHTKTPSNVHPTYIDPFIHCYANSAFAQPAEPSYPWSNHPSVAATGIPNSPYIISVPVAPCADFLQAVYDPSRIMTIAGDPIRSQDERPLTSSHADIYMPLTVSGGGAGRASMALTAAGRSQRSVSTAPSPQSSPNMNGVALLVGAGSVIQRLLHNYEGFGVSLQAEHPEALRKRACRDARRSMRSEKERVPHSAVHPSSAVSAPEGALLPWRMTDFTPTNRQRKRIELHDLIYHGIEAYESNRNLIAAPLPSNSSSNPSVHTSAATTRASSTVIGSSNSLFSQWNINNTASEAGGYASTNGNTPTGGGTTASMTGTRASFLTDAERMSVRASTVSGLVFNDTKSTAYSSGSGSSGIGLNLLRPIAAPLATFHGPAWDEDAAPITCMSSASSWLVTGGTKGTVTLWDADSAVQQRRLIPCHFKGIVPTNETVLFAQFTYNINSPIVLGSTDSTLRLFDPQTEAVYATHTYPEQGPMGVCTRLTPNVTLAAAHSGSIFAVDWRTRSSHVWMTHLPLEQGAGTSLLSLHHHGAAAGSLGVAAASGDPSMGDPYGCVVGTTLGFLSIFDLRFRLNVKSFSVSTGPSVPKYLPVPRTSNISTQSPHSASFRPQSPRGGAPALSLPTASIDRAPCSVLSMCLDPRTALQQRSSDNAPQVIVSTSDGTVQRWDVEKEERTLLLKTHSHTVTKVLLHVPRAPLVLTGSEDRLIRLWDFTNPQNSRTLACLPQHSGPYEFNIRSQIFSEGAPVPPKYTAPDSNTTILFGGTRPHGVTTLNPFNSSLSMNANSIGHQGG